MVKNTNNLWNDFDKPVDEYCWHNDTQMSRSALPELIELFKSDDGLHVAASLSLAEGVTEMLLLKCICVKFTSSRH